MDPVASLLLEGRVDVEAVPALVEAGLASVAARALERQGGGAAAGTSGDPARAALARARVETLARHAAAKAAVGPLLAAWRRAGLDVLAFKGFYLAEAVHRDPADRPYSDVDVALRAGAGMPDDPAELARAAAELAEAAGWRVVWRLGEAPRTGSLHDERYDGHELLQLVHARTGLECDVHRRLVHNNLNIARASAAAERITAAVWEASEPVTLAGVEVRAPSHVDSALVGLVAARSWSGDRHELRPHDFLDLAALMAAGGFGVPELLARAGELGMARTAAVFTDRCDPARGVLDLAAPGGAEMLVLDLRMVPERWPRGVAQAMRKLGLRYEESVAAVGAWPAVSDQVRRWRRGGVAAPAEGHATAVGSAPPDRRSWREAQMGVRRALHLHGLGAESHPRLALACLLAVAERRGFHVTVGRGRAGLALFAGGERLPLDQLGSSAAAAAGWWPDRDTRPPAGPLARLRSVGAGGLLLRGEALVQLWLARRSLASGTFAEVQARWAGRAGGARSGRPVAASPERDEVLALGRAVASASRFVPDARCVAQSLAGQAMLSRRGVPSRIHFGFRRGPDGAVAGHAWLEALGAVVVGDEGLDEFTRTATFDA